MKRTWSCGALAASLVMGGLPGSVPPAGADQPTRSTGKSVFSTLAFNECNGEFVLIEGVLHVTEFTSENGSRAAVSVSNGKGTGLATGASYVVAGTEHVSFTSKPGGASHDNYEATLLLVTPGGQENLVGHMTIRTVTNANGQTTAVVENVRIECRG